MVKDENEVRNLSQQELRWLLEGLSLQQPKAIAKSAKANGIDFYKYLVKLLTELPNLPIHQQAEILNQYLP